MKNLFLIITFILIHFYNYGQKPRARDLGVPFVGKTGEFNAITDVQGVEVGYSTIISGNGENIIGKGPVRTGVTAIFPRGKEKKFSPVYANWYSLNGNGTISYKTAAPVIWREVQAGALNGLMIGIIVAIISVVWNDSALLGLVVGMAMIGVHIIAGFFGAFVPVFLKHLGMDPAAMSTMIITTATDVLGLFILLGLASLILL